MLEEYITTRPTSGFLFRTSIHDYDKERPLLSRQ